MFRRNIRRPRNLCLQGMTMMMMIIVIIININIIIIIIIIIAIIIFVFKSLTSEIPFPSSCEEATISVSIPLKSSLRSRRRERRKINKYLQARSARRQHRAREKVRGAIIVSAPFPYRSALASRPPPQFPPLPFRFAPATQVN